VWQRSIGNFSEQFEGFSEHDIFHGTTTHTNNLFLANVRNTGQRAAITITLQGNN